jgi:hypothetical protein
MATNDSLPRFIETQGGSCIAIAHIRILRCTVGDDMNPFDDDGPHDVVADVGGNEWERIGSYKSMADAKDALKWIMAQADTPGSGTVFAPPRDVDTQETCR